ncbi:putative leucine-rich repeat receptor-like protein kinase At2g19210 [Neltuma alba]|uniref:putative leucine-rich repeat receptor-like protein kinase At2g19210 n=1 Tax=Neltuma alba TaxID=207710 RepID=UPI0010A46E48|nr:putative leucine-rich repeat receptor-like protein kinase At2g19210 [Prosopis alba]
MADDGSVVDSGQIYNLSSEYALDGNDEQVWQQMNNVRSFPEGKRNCYTLKPKQGKNNFFLVRAYYKYGNYDYKNSAPFFHFHLGVNFWTGSGNTSNDRRTEAIHVSRTNNVDVRLINTGRGKPFISLLELWPLKDSIYLNESDFSPLGVVTRSSLGTSKADYVFITYPEDIYGRSWYLGREIEDSEPIATSVLIDGDVSNYKLPREVLGTAIRSGSGSSLFIELDYSTNYEYYVYLHFYDFVERPQDQQRKMEITFTDTIRDNITLQYRVLKTMVRRMPKGEYLSNISVTSTPDSGLPPMINALEIYRVLPQSDSPTQERDVNAMRIVKQAYKITRNWQGDPCMPRGYSWDGLNCSYFDNIPRITSLNLSSSKLTGHINTSFSDLISLESPDLSNNQLKGEIPEVLGKLPNLKLLEQSKWPNSKGPNGEERQSFNIEVIQVQSLIHDAIGISLPFVATLFQNDGNLKSKNRAFNHWQVLSITNSFETVIGQGGFGKVYLGTLQDGTKVAVKLLSKSSQQGFKEFQSEAELLMVVHHRNLVSLVGYCNDGDTKALVYEYMDEGNLRQKLSDKNPYALKWNERLQIALDAACGV